MESPEKPIFTKKDYQKLSYGEIFHILQKTSIQVYDIRLMTAPRVDFDDPKEFCTCIFNKTGYSIGFRCLVGNLLDKHAWIFFYRPLDLPLWVALHWKFEDTKDRD